MKRTSLTLATLILVFLFGLTLPLSIPTYGQLTPTRPLYLPHIVNPPSTPTFTPTPTRTPTATPTAPAPAHVRITYILYDPPNGTLEEFVRLQNTGGTAQNMTGWTLRDIANHVFIFPNFSLPAGGTVQIWTKSGNNTGTDLYWGSAQAIWNNSGDTAILQNASGQVISTCTYAGGQTQYTCP